VDLLKLPLRQLLEAVENRTFVVENNLFSMSLCLFLIVSGHQKK
jgi:hypothetical protein